MFKKAIFIFLLLPAVIHCMGREAMDKQIVVYLFPGQGADYRQFRNLNFPENYDTVHISYPVPEKGESLPEFAQRFIPLIDPDIPFILVGVSLGGMICTELAELVHPQQVILISSAKGKDELPDRYTFMARSHINRIVPKSLVKAGARVLQGIVEPDRKYDRDTFSDMLKKKDPLYLKRSADMIICWQRKHHNEDIIHIHGDADNTIPIKNVAFDYLIEDGSHMMVLTRADEINEIIAILL